MFSLSMLVHRCCDSSKVEGKCATNRGSQHFNRPPKRELRWSIPCATMAFIYHRLIHDWTDGWQWLNETTQAEMTGFSMFTSILGFLIVFRAQLSYARYWEGITLAERACGVWLNGCSNLIAFCNTSRELREEVRALKYPSSKRGGALPHMSHARAQDVAFSVLAQDVLVEDQASVFLSNGDQVANEWEPEWCVWARTQGVLRR